MKERACIYCGTTENLSSSDIIPDALTNVKIINPCVCRDAHNSKFSNMFEHEIIKNMAFITNELNIKSSKAKKYAVYPAQILINGEVFEANISSDTELFGKGNILTTEDGNKKLGSLEKIKKFKGFDEKEITALDLNNLDVYKRVSIEVDFFFGDAMHRLMAKIAFEWYCLHNKVTDKIEDFNNIIDFITTGDISKDPVEFVGNEAIYLFFEEQSDLGNHTILSYIGVDDSVNVIVSFFGIAVYNIKLLSHPIERCTNNAIYQVVTTDSKRVQFCFRTPENISENIISSLKKTDCCNGLSIMIPNKMDDISLYHKLMYLTNYELFQNELNCITSLNNHAYNLLKRNIINITYFSALTLKGLKRFVKEHNESLNSGKELNPNGQNKKDIFLLYILFAVGSQGSNWCGIKDILAFVKKKFANDKINISDEVSDNLFSEMLGTENYLDIIKCGAKIVEGWKNE